MVVLKGEVTMNRVAAQRLHNQQLEQSRFSQPEQVVGWLGAVQAQEYADAKFALGIRLPESRDSQIEQAFNEGRVLRTHVMRPTWHFVTPEDIRWMQALTAPRVHSVSAYYYRQLEIDNAVARQSIEVISRALEGGGQLTRQELGEKLAEAGIAASGQRLAYLVMYAELEAVICSGARRGKQFTYALLSERAPQAKVLPRDEALAALVLRYFSSHGPAQVKDFVWWSGLTVADTKAGLALLGGQLASEVIDGKTYWYSPAQAAIQPAPMPKAYLLHIYDEYGVAYKDRSDLLPPEFAELSLEVAFSGFVVLSGQVVASWRRAKVTKQQMRIEHTPLRSFDEREGAAITAAVRRYSDFLGIPVVVEEGG